MAVSCPEVMYGAYYPYLYGRGAARSFHHAPHFQYDRLNVQSASNAGGEYASGAGGVSSGSASSGAQSPGSPPHAHALPLAHHAHLHHHHAHHAHAAHPAHTAHTAHTAHPAPAHHSPRLRAKEEDLSAHGRASADGGSSESEGECGGGGGRARAQYVSANCVVFTHYSGDVAAVVDEHFARALAVDKPKEGVPMASRNLPASFFNAAASGACALELYEYDPWHQHYGGYSRAAEYANMAGYPPLLLGRSSLHAQYKPVDWPAHAHAHAHAHHAHHAQLDPTCTPYSYPAPPGLEAQVQDTSKDLYWF